MAGGPIQKPDCVAQAAYCVFHHSASPTRNRAVGSQTAVLRRAQHATWGSSARQQQAQQKENRCACRLSRGVGRCEPCQASWMGARPQSLDNGVSTQPLPTKGADMNLVFFTPETPVHLVTGAVQTQISLHTELQRLWVLPCTSVEWLPGGPVRLVPAEPQTATAFQLPASWVLLVAEVTKDRSAGFLAGLPATATRSDQAA